MTLATQPAAYSPPSLPVPTLAYDFTVECDLDPKISVGIGPWGHRNWISLTGGRFHSKWATGRILPGGQDSQVVLADLSTRIETNYIIELDLLDGHARKPYLVMRTSGWRTGPAEVLARLADPVQAAAVDPASYSFRLYVHMETGSQDAGLSWVNTAMWVGSGAREGFKVIYNAYRIG